MSAISVASWWRSSVLMKQAMFGTLSPLPFDLRYTTTAPIHFAEMLWSLCAGMPSVLVQEET